MEVPTHRELVDHINEHLDETGERPSAFGRRVLGDGAAITRLCKGTDPRLSTVNKIADAIKKE